MATNQEEGDKTPAEAPVGADRQAKPQEDLSKLNILAKETIRLWVAPYVEVARNLAVAPAIAIIVTTIGFLVSVPQYARAGVPIGSLPLLNLVQAGLCFIILSGISIYIGIVIGHIDRVPTKVSYLVLGASAFSLLTSYRLPASLLLPFYLFFPFIFGHTYAKAIGRVLKGAPIQTKPDVFMDLIRFGNPLLLSALFAVFAFPVVPPELGGGRPKPVTISWVSTQDAITNGNLYEVFRDSSTIYLAVDTARKPFDWASRLTFMLDDSRTLYYAIPMTQIRSIQYTPWVVWSLNKPHQENISILSASFSSDASAEVDAGRNDTAEGEIRSENSDAN